jgi:hypothetical protein
MIFGGFLLLVKGFLWINNGLFLDVDFPILCSCSGWLCVGSGYG